MIQAIAKKRKRNLLLIKNSNNPFLLYSEQMIGTQNQRETC